MTTDRSGFIWMGTENGVYRFLGSRFEKYGQQQGILDRDIQDIYADPNGTVWVGTEENPLPLGRAGIPGRRQEPHSCRGSAAHRRSGRAFPAGD